MVGAAAAASSDVTAADPLLLAISVVAGTLLLPPTH
jgi:hypothetical protein